MSATVPIHLDQVLVDRITELGLLRYPAEACGILLPTPMGRDRASQVVELPNRSLRPHDEYIIKPDDVIQVLETWAKQATTEQKNAISVWHTHPGGNIGPSSADLKKRIIGAAYLVVAVDVETGHGTPCWF